MNQDESCSKLQIELINKIKECKSIRQHSIIELITLKVMLKGNVDLIKCNTERIAIESKLKQLQCNTPF